MGCRTILEAALDGGGHRRATIVRVGTALLGPLKKRLKRRVFHRASGHGIRCGQFIRRRCWALQPLGKWVLTRVSPISRSTTSGTNQLSSRYISAALEAPGVLLCVVRHDCGSAALSSGEPRRIDYVAEFVYNSAAE